MNAMRQLRIFTLISFCNSLGIILVSPFESFEDHALVLKLPFIFGAGCVIQLVALIFAYLALRKIDHAAKMRMSYTIVLSLSFVMTILWVLVAFIIYRFTHLMDDVGVMNFGHM